jgi:diaminopimelate epimerase
MTPLDTEFFKMSAGGNDFLLFDNRQGVLRAGDSADFIRHVCTRALAVGGDGVILLEGSNRAHLRVRFFNPDGQPTFCGNGARCAARLAYLKGMAPARMTLESDLMVHHAEVAGTEVSVEMRDPRGFGDGIEVQALGETIRGAFVDTGVPHLVVFREIPADQPIDALGRALRAHPRFAPDGVNVNFVRPVAEGLAIRTFERGVEGETLACGTGCVAAAVAAAAGGRATPPVTLITRSGESLRVRFEGDPRRAVGVRLEGPARLIYVGHLSEEATRGFAPAR